MSTPNKHGIFMQLWHRKPQFWPMRVWTMLEGIKAAGTCSLASLYLIIQCLTQFQSQRQQWMFLAIGDQTSDTYNGQFWNLQPKILVLVWTCIVEGVNTMTNAASPSKFSQRSWFWIHLKEISPLPARLLHHFDFKRAWPSSVFLLCMFTPCESYSVYEWKIIAAYLKGFV